MKSDTADIQGDAGLHALVLLLRVHGIPLEAEQIRHRMGKHAIGVTEMLRYAKELGLKARTYHTKWGRLASTPLPGGFTPCPL